MKKNTISVLFFIIASFFSCSSSPVTAETITDNTPIETIKTEVTTESAFEKLLKEFESCEQVELLLSNEVCAKAKEDKGSAKLASLANQILDVTGRDVGVKYFMTEDALETALTYEENDPTISVGSLIKTSWQDLVFLNLTIAESNPPIENQTSMVFIFTKSGKFKDAFIIYSYSGDAQSQGSSSISKVEKTANSLKLIINTIRGDENGNETETNGDFYLITKDGIVTYDDSQKK